LKKYRYPTIAAVLFLFSAPAAAVELGDITVSSHLGEPFRAAVSMRLDAGEDPAALSIGLAAPADYRSLNIHRARALNGMQADVIGRSRIELSSRSPVDTAFFTLVLKVRDAHAIHFKQYRVFLNLPHTGKSLRQSQPGLAVVGEAGQEPAAAPQPRADAEAGATISAAPVSSFKPFDGWARTSRYGPVVHGDILSVISDRLRIDERYSLNQVMAALFEKNRSRFAEDNLNLPRDGAYLDAPTAAEVERNTPDQALAIVQDHNRRWKELTRQPRYAAIA
jgi:FimV-like protein